MKKDNPLIECKCGCGKLRPKYDKKGREGRYIYGHIFNINNPMKMEKNKIKVSKFQKNFRKGKTYEEIYGKELSDKLKEKRSIQGKNRVWSFITRQKISKSNKGKKNSIEARKKMMEAKLKNPTRYWLGITLDKHPSWKGGKSFEIYPYQFNNTLKEQIRARDNHTCQECNFTEEQLRYKLNVHHIDFNKKNNNPNNLISLCRSCHAQTNFNREKWTKYFKTKFEEAQLTSRDVEPKAL